MLIRFHSCNLRFYSALSVSKICNMNTNKCYLRYVQDDERVDITFLLKIKDSIRQFNLSRSPSEDIASLTTRIESNVQKVINKNNRKKLVSDNKVTIKICTKTGLFPEKYTCKDLFEFRQPLMMKINDENYEIVFNEPWITSIGISQSILAGFPVYPENLKMLFSDIKKCQFKWYRGKAVNEKGKTMSDENIQWEFICENFSYIPTLNDIGMKLKVQCIPGNEVTSGPAVDAISKGVVEAGPGKCPFETRHMFTTSVLKGKSFRCVSYNILADLYCDSEFTRTVLHPYCPPYALNIDYRKQLLMKELLGYNADIICLQEVDRKIFQHWLSPFLDNAGFKGQFYRKGKEVAEGLACFYRSLRFRFLGEEQIILSEAIKTYPCLQNIWNIIKTNGPLVERLLDRSTVASVTFLESVENSDELLLVGNTHLYFHPDADHIRLIQGGIFIYWINDVRKKIMEKFPDKKISLILCGDYNSVPTCGIYQLYTTGIAPSTLPDWKSNETESVQGLNLEQDILLASACGTPTYTNFTAEFADCLDYIFYDTSSLEVEQVIPFPSIDELKANVALPSVVFPSDHIALISDLRFK